MSVGKSRKRPWLVRGGRGPRKPYEKMKEPGSGQEQLGCSMQVTGNWTASKKDQRINKKKRGPSNLTSSVDSACVAVCRLRFS